MTLHSDSGDAFARKHGQGRLFPSISLGFDKKTGARNLVPFILGAYHLITV